MPKISRSVTPELPEYDPRDPVESAVMARLAGNWHRRAAVKREEPDLDDLFDPGRPDYPEALLPFRDHPTYRQLDGAVQSEVLSWAWIAFNKNVMDIEQQVVNPGFALLAEDAFGTGLDETLATAVAQAMVDEQYHTLMHLNASAVTRRRRGLRMPDSALPLGHKARMHRRHLAAAEHRWQRELTTLAFTTVAEISINAYLDLIAEDTRIQPVNQVTAALHNRDEYCHSAIADEIAKAVYARLDAGRRKYFLQALCDGMEGFAANDFAVWRRIVETVGIEGGSRMIDEVEHDASRKRLLQDFGALHGLCADMGVLGEIPFDWSAVSI